MDRPAIPSDVRGTTSELVPLLAAVARGDRAAFADLYARTSAKMYGIALRVMGSEQDAEDVLHEAYLTVWRNAGRFEPGRASPITWLSVLTRNKAIDRLRQRRAPTEPIEAVADLPADQPSAFDVAEHEQDRQRLAHCLDQLEQRARDVIREAFFTGATYADLAARADVPLGTMKSRIRRGLASLRLCLDQ